MARHHQERRHIQRGYPVCNVFAIFLSINACAVAVAQLRRVGHIRSYAEAHHSIVFSGWIIVIDTFVALVLLYASYDGFDHNRPDSRIGMSFMAPLAASGVLFLLSASWMVFVSLFN